MTINENSWMADPMSKHGIVIRDKYNEHKTWFVYLSKDRHWYLEQMVLGNVTSPKRRCRKAWIQEVLDLEIKKIRNTTKVWIVPKEA